MYLSSKAIGRRLGPQGFKRLGTLLPVGSRFVNSTSNGRDAASSETRTSGRRRAGFLGSKVDLRYPSADMEDSLLQKLSDCLVFSSFLLAPKAKLQSTNPYSVALPDLPRDQIVSSMQKNHFLSNSSLKLIESMLRSPLLGEKVLQLVCPHPGGSSGLEFALDSVCERSNYKVLRLNFHHLFQISNQLTTSKRSDSLKEVRDGPDWKEVFVPHKYWVKSSADTLESTGNDAAAFQEDDDAIDEEFEDYVEDEETEYFADDLDRPKNFPPDIWQLLSSSKAVLEDSESSKSPPLLIKFSNLKNAFVGNSSAAAVPFRQPSFLLKTLYSTPLPILPLSLADGFERFLEQESSISAQKVVIHFSDATEFALSSSQNAALLMELVKRAQKFSFPVVFSCTPSVLDQRNASLPVSWWDKFFTSKKLINRQSHNFASSGGNTELEQKLLLSTVFDHWDFFNGLSFVKIPFLPPPFCFDVHSKNKIQRWTRCLGELQQLAIYRLNLATVSLFAQSSVPPATFLPLLFQELEEAKTGDALIDQWRKSVFDVSEIDQLMTTAAGLADSDSGELGMEQISQAGTLLQSFFPPDPSQVSSSSGASNEAKRSSSSDVQGTTQAAEPSSSNTESSPSEPPSKLDSLDKKHLSTYERKALSCVVDSKRIDFSFNDLILPPSTTHTLQSLVTLPLLQPELFTGILRKHPVSGVLLFGPPGTGKSALAKAVAQSGGANFMNISLSDVFEKYVGEGEKNVKAIFSIARKLSPTVLFLDEVDALFAKREGFRESRRDILNEFMSEWDGLLSGASKTAEESAPPRILVMAATNRPFDLDDAILRRLPRRILVNLPDESARYEILRVHLRSESFSPSLEAELRQIALKTKNWSGSDLKNLCVSAALWSVKEQIWQSLYPEASLNDWQSFEAWGAAFSDLKKAGPLKPSSTRSLTPFHFQLAFKEIGPSLHEDMASMAELIKWDKVFGSGANSPKSRTSFGFSFGNESDGYTFKPEAGEQYVERQSNASLSTKGTFRDS